MGPLLKGSCLVLTLLFRGEHVRIQGRWTLRHVGGGLLLPPRRESTLIDCVMLWTCVGKLDDDCRWNRHFLTATMDDGCRVDDVGKVFAG